VCGWHACVFACVFELVHEHMNMHVCVRVCMLEPAHANVCVRHGSAHLHGSLCTYSSDKNSEELDMKYVMRYSCFLCSHASPN
jgi:hypothetical protein